MPDLEIVFRTKAELQGAIQTKEALEKQVGAAKALGQPIEELEGKLKRVTAAIGKQGDAFHETTSKITEVAKAVGGQLLGAFGLAGSGFELLSKSLQKFAAAEVRTTQLDAALKQAG